MNMKCNEWLRSRTNRTHAWRRFYYKWKDSTDKAIVQHLEKTIPEDFLTIFKTEKEIKI